MTVLVAILLLTGCALAFIAALGLHRLPDVFCRMHAATKPAALGITLVLIGATLSLSETAAVTKLILVIALQLLTVPVGAHMIGRAAYRAGGLLVEGTTPDELADAFEGHKRLPTP